MGESTLHSTIRRWHRYAGLALSPVILAVAVTGAVYAFKNTVEPHLDRAPASPAEASGISPPPSADAWIAAATEAAPEHAPWRLYLDADSGGAVEVHLLDDAGERLRVAVEPSGARVIAIERFESRPFRVVLNLHRSLFMGIPGRLLTEIVAGWSLVLAGTGLMMWNRTRRPARNRGAAGGRSSSKRSRRRAFHGTVGVITAVPVIYLAATGLLFTLGTGSVLKGAAYLSGAIPRSPVRPPQSRTELRPARIGAARALAIAETQGGITRPLLLTLPRSPEEPYVAQTNDTAEPSRYARVVVDAYTGELVDRMTWSDLSAPMKLLTSAYSLHTGDVSGWPTRVFALVGALGVAALAVSGAAMWRLGRPSAFPRIEGAALPALRGHPVRLAALVALATLMPAFAGSVAVIAAVERIRARRARRSGRDRGHEVPKVPSAGIRRP